MKSKSASLAAFFQRMLTKCNSKEMRHAISIVISIINPLQNWNHPLGQKVQGQGIGEWQRLQSTG